MKKDKNPSEIRVDKVLKDWVVVATGRSRKPKDFKKNVKKTKKVPKKNCPFCDIKNQKDPVIVFNKGREVNNYYKKPKQWTTISIPNKYPAFNFSQKLEKKKVGIFFEKMNAVGFHEVVITKYHHKPMALMSKNEIKEVIEVYSRRYDSLIKKKNVGYVSIFQNHGHGSGASIYHPHSQIIAIPSIDSDLEDYFYKIKKHKETKECFYCETNNWEIKQKKRIIYQNKDFVAICPFVSKVSFHVIISPKKHLSFFEKITDNEKENLADIFKVVLMKLYKGLGNPPYNYYLNSAPCDNKDHSYHHWHWVIFPKTSGWAGFELGVGVEISTIQPEKAAKYLRDQKIKKP
jgi:UDPglucose--hexose-1-phosphate uridylyltransferase